MLEHVVIAGLVLAAGCGKSGGDGTAGGGTGSTTASPVPVPVGPPVELTILYGSEKKTWLEEQVASFNATTPKVRSGGVIHVKGKAVGSGEAMTAILEGTDKPVVRCCRRPPRRTTCSPHEARHPRIGFAQP